MDNTFFDYNDFNIETYAEGNFFPRKRDRVGDGNVFEYLNIGPSIIAYYSNPTYEEIAAFKGEQVELAFLNYECVLIVMAKIGVALVECPFNVRLYSEDYDVRNIGRMDHLNIFLVDADTNIIESMRSIQLAPYFAKGLWNSIESQYDKAFSKDYYNGLYTAIMRQYDTNTLFDNAEYSMYYPSVSMMERMEAVEKITMKQPVDLSKNGEITILITKNDVDNDNLQGVLDRFNVLLRPEFVYEMKQVLTVSFCGYGNDMREVYEIEEVRDFLYRLDEKFPYWFYFCNLENQGLLTLTLCFCDAAKISGHEFDYSHLALAKFMERHFSAYNYLAEALRLSEKEIEEMSDKLASYYGF